MPSVSAVLAAIKAETQRFSDLPTPLLAPQQVSHLTGRPTSSLKDPALAYSSGRFFLFVSDFSGPIRALDSHLVGVSTTDFRRYELVLDHADGASPTLFSEGGKHYLCFCSGFGLNSRHGHKLWVSTSTDLRSWSTPVPLASTVTGGARAIDPALGRVDGRLWLVYKEGQTVATARSCDGGGALSTCWEKKGSVHGGWAENTQFYTHSNGSLLLVGTAHGTAHGTASERPFAARVVSSGPKLRLGPRSFLEVPDAEGWAERRAAANAIWLVDAGAWGATSEVWAVYCKRRPLGREERALQRVKRAAGAPAHHNSNYSIGVARSAHDLVRWEVPGGIRS